MVVVSVRSYHAGLNLFPFGFLYLIAILWSAWQSRFIAWRSSEEGAASVEAFRAPSFGASRSRW